MPRTLWNSTTPLNTFDNTWIIGGMGTIADRGVQDPNFEVF